jgi:hypothetical protein
MLNNEVYSNNTCSEDDLKRGTQSADPTISPAEPSLFFKYERACKVINDMGQTNYGPFRVWLKHEKLFVKMSVWIHKTNGNLLSKQLCFQTVLEVLIQILAVTALTVVLSGFPQYLQEIFKIVPQILPQPIPATSFLIHYSLIILACKAILHEKQTAPLYKPQINT